jgi:L-asparagine transporter-like permease
VYAALRYLVVDVDVGRIGEHKLSSTIYVSSYYCMCILILCLCVLVLLYMCPHTTVYVSSYFCICVLILLYLCPHTRELAQVQAVVEYEALSF